MARYKVTKLVDAYVHYTAVVELPEDATNEEIIQKAKDNQLNLDWQEEDTQEFDHTEWDMIGPEKLED